MSTVPNFIRCCFTPGGGGMPYVGYIGMCRCEGYGFQAVYSRIGYINQNIWVWFFSRLGKQLL